MGQPVPKLDASLRSIAQALQDIVRAPQGSMPQCPSRVDISLNEGAYEEV